MAPGPSCCGSGPSRWSPCSSAPGCSPRSTSTLRQPGELLRILDAGTLIGIVANGVGQRADAMRRGRSTVVESGHVAILGASNRLSVIIEQLALASRRRRTNGIVVLADREPVQLGDEARVTAAALARQVVEELLDFRGV